MLELIDLGFSCRPDARARSTAATGLPHGAGHAAQHAGNDGDQLWGPDAPNSHANAGLCV